jgi:hypothetical protein
VARTAEPDDAPKVEAGVLSPMRSFSASSEKNVWWRMAARIHLVTSQLDPSDWHDYLTDPTLADAICDRLLSHAHRIVLKGPSRRKEKETTSETRTKPASLRSDHDDAKRSATITRNDWPPSAKYALSSGETSRCYE